MQHSFENAKLFRLQKYLIALWQNYQIGNTSIPLSLLKWLINSSIWVCVYIVFEYAFCRATKPIHLHQNVRCIDVWSWMASGSCIWFNNIDFSWIWIKVVRPLPQTPAPLAHWEMFECHFIVRFRWVFRIVCMSRKREWKDEQCFFLFSDGKPQSRRYCHDCRIWKKELAVLIRISNKPLECFLVPSCSLILSFA